MHVLDRRKNNRKKKKKKRNVEHNKIGFFDFDANARQAGKAVQRGQGDTFTLSVCISMHFSLRVTHPRQNKPNFTREARKKEEERKSKTSDSFAPFRYVPFLEPSSYGG